MVVMLLLFFWAFVALVEVTVAAPVQDGRSHPFFPPLFPREDSFSCPVYKTWTGARNICSGDDIIWNNETVLGKHVTFYIPPNEPTIVRPGPARRNAVVEMFEQAMKKGLAYYEPWGANTIVYLGIVGEGFSAWGSGNAVEDTNGELERCELVIRWPGAREDPMISLRTMKSVVHELYHCVQYAQNLKGRNGGTSDHRSWWIEGTARFFDGVMYPITRKDMAILGRGQFPEEYDPAISLVEQSYEAALFYHYLNNIGVETSRINQWVASKMGRSSVAEDLADLEKTPLFADNWHGFAEMFVLNKINYTTTIPINIVSRLRYVETVNLSQDVGGKLTTTTRRFRGFRFIVGRYNFPAGTEYSVVSAKGVMCSRRILGGTWLSVAEVFEVVADEPGSIEVVCSCNKAAGCAGQLVFERTR